MWIAMGRIQWRLVVHEVMGRTVQKMTGNFLASLAIISFSRRTILHELRELYDFFLIL
jgi:hypothetical protein